MQTGQGNATNTRMPDQIILICEEVLLVNRRKLLSVANLINDIVPLAGNYMFWPSHVTKGKRLSTELKALLRSSKLSESSGRTKMVNYF
jgi:hypothetical protein